MKPSQVAYKLRRIASAIDKSTNPRRDLVADDLRQIVAILMSPERMPEELEANRRLEREEKFRESPSPFGHGNTEVNFQVLIPDDVGGETEYDIVADMSPADPDVGVPAHTEYVSIHGPGGEEDVDEFMDKYGQWVEDALIEAIEP